MAIRDRCYNAAQVERACMHSQDVAMPTTGLSCYKVTMNLWGMSRLLNIEV